MILCSAVNCIRILGCYVTVLLPSDVSWHFPVYFQILHRLQWFVDTLTKEMKGEEDKKVVEECLYIGLVIDIRSKSTKAILIPKAKPNSGQAGDI